VQVVVNGHAVEVATGGCAHEPGRPWVALLHGAGMNHSVWALQSRWLAFQGWNVLAIDLPGHGRSAGAPLPTIAALADWLPALVEVVGAPSAALVGHSMGSLIALETAARHPAVVDRLVLIAASAGMPVHPDLLAAAAVNEHSAIDMVNLWGHGFDAGLGGSRAPGVWMAGAAERILEQAAPGVLHADLAACGAYRDGLASAAKVAARTLLICGEKDQMTPLKGALALAAALPNAEVVTLRRAGHMLLAERPLEVLSALARHLGSTTERT
jgi:pimeloyl-ACP methyl ester carboxylesterase